MTRWFWLSVVVTVLTIGATCYVYYGHYDKIPARIPIHWNIEGQADDFIAKDRGLRALLTTPGIMVAILLLNWILPWLSPKKFEVDQFRSTFDYVMTLVVVMSAYVQTVLLISIFEKNLDVGRFLIGGIFVFLALIGNVLGRVRRNFWMGIRTPWTLASETVWIRTHRLAAWCFTAGGALGAAAIFLGTPPVWCFVGLISFVLIPVIYSLILYKRLESQGRFNETNEKNSLPGETS